MNTSALETLQSLGQFSAEQITDIQKQSAVINKLTLTANEKIDRYQQLPPLTPATLQEGLEIQALQIQTLHEKTELLHQLIEDLYKRQGHLVNLLETVLNP